MLHKKAQAVDSATTKKKPFYKKPWFIIVVVLAIIGAVGSQGKDTEDKKPDKPVESVAPAEQVNKEPAKEKEEPIAQTPAYELISTDEYSRDSKLCGAYRVVVTEDMPQTDLLLVYQDLVSNDEYYLHTVFFYGQATDVETVGAYTVGMLEQTEENTDPVFSEPTLSASDIEALRAGEPDIEPVTPETSEPDQPTIVETLGQQNAKGAALAYLRFTAFSYKGLIGQLEFDGYTNEEATYGADNCGANWNEQAYQKAQDYLAFTAFSYTGLVDQLVFDGFASSEATYGADNCGADWNAQAEAKAKSYLDFMEFSRQGLIDQLVFDGFTASQATAGATAVGY